MSMDRGRRRIVFAMCTRPQDRRTLDWILGVVHALQAELEVVFIEDLDFLRTASLPFVSLIDPLTSQVHPFDTDSTERWLQSVAMATEEDLAALAQHHDVPCSFRRLRHHIADALEQIAIDADLVILPRDVKMRSGQAFGRHHRGPTLVLPRLRQGRFAVGCMLLHAPSLRRTLPWARQLLPHRSAGLAIAWLGDLPPLSPDDLPLLSGPNVEIHQFHPSASAEATRWLLRRCASLVFDVEVLDLEDPVLEHVLDEPDRPVLIVR